MRKDDWITKLYYKQLSEKSTNNRDSGKVVPSKKNVPTTQNQIRKRKHNRS